MKMSRRAKRMKKNHKKGKLQASLNMVSLMDIFTILVFFLLVNSSTVQQLPNNKDIKLPTATVEKLPEETLVVLVSGKEILVQGRKVADVPEEMASDDELIQGLKRELEHQARRSRLTAEGQDEERDVIILGDRKIPYKLLKKIMLTCSDTNYTKISLAVQRKTRNKG